MAKQYVYETSCVECGDRVEALNKMIEEAVDVNYSAVLRNCHGLIWWAELRGYRRNVNHGLTLKDDWHVGFYKSTFEGKPCYFVRWSAIEFIWVKSTTPLSQGDDYAPFSRRPL